ncbi:MAG: hypothetical protein WC340_01195 [Kiritimatiellia bacterium]
MKSISIDTCVVLRLLVGTLEKQSEQAVGFLQESFSKGVRICVSDLVVAESYHALIYHYNVPKLKAI